MIYALPMILETSSSQILSGNLSSTQGTTLGMPQLVQTTQLTGSQNVPSNAGMTGQHGGVISNCNISGQMNAHQHSAGGTINAHNFASGTVAASVEEQLMKLEHFLNTSPNTFTPNESIKRFSLGNNEVIACAYWRGSFFISGTDIVKILSYRFQLIGKQIPNQKKFEEGIFSDLRSLKPGVDSILEEARSEFLEMLYKNGCVRTQKKQKVFFWYSVPHERLFLDALERDRKRENLFNPGAPSNNPLSSMGASGLQFGGSGVFSNGGGFASSGYAQYAAGFMAGNSAVNMNSIGPQQSALGMMMYQNQSQNTATISGNALHFPQYHCVSNANNALTGSTETSPAVNQQSSSYQQLLNTFGTDQFSKQSDYFMSTGTMDPLNLVTMQQSSQDEVSIVFDDPAFQELFDNVIDNRVQFSSSDLATL